MTMVSCDVCGSRATFAVTISLEPLEEGDEGPRKAAFDFCGNCRPIVKLGLPQKYGGTPFYVDREKAAPTTTKGWSDPRL